MKSDRKPVGLSLRLKGLRTSARFPLFKHTAFYFPPSTEADGPPFSPERSFVSQDKLFLSFGILTFFKRTQNIGMLSFAGR